MLGNFPALLRGVVLVRQPPLRLRFDLKRIGLRAVRGGDDQVSTIELQLSEVE